MRVARIADPSSPQAVAAAAAFLLSFYVGLALAYRDAIPLFEAPDEPSHIHYAAFVREHGDLPRQDPLEVPGEGMQPPLVYVLAAPLLGNSAIDIASAVRELDAAMSPLYSHPRREGGGSAIAFRPNDDRMFATDGSLESLRVLRSTSLVFGLLTVILTFAAVWRLTHDARFALLAGALLAFNPQFLFVSAYFSNDPAAASTGAAVLWVIVRALEDAGNAPMRRHYVVGAAVIALGLLTKTSTLPGLAVAAVTLIAIDPRPRREVMIDTGIAAALVLCLGGPYLVWAAEHRGGLLGWNAMFASSVSMMRPDRFGGWLPYFTGLYWDAVFESYWARFGWFNVTVPKATYLAFFALTWIGVLGWFAGRSRLPAKALLPRALRRLPVRLVRRNARGARRAQLRGCERAGPTALRGRAARRVPARARHLPPDRQRAAPAPARDRDRRPAARARRLLPARGADPGVLGTGAGLVAHRFGRRLRRATSCASASASSRDESAPSRYAARIRSSARPTLGPERPAATRSSPLIGRRRWRSSLA